VACFCRCYECAGEEGEGCEEVGVELFYLLCIMSRHVMWKTDRDNEQKRTDQYGLHSRHLINHSSKVQDDIAAQIVGSSTPYHVGKRAKC
jgi:hypothetical protein